MSEPFVAKYRNWRGEVAERRITPERVFFGANQWHPKAQWLLVAFDHDKRASRIFALSGFTDLEGAEE